MHCRKYLYDEKPIYTHNVRIHDVRLLSQGRASECQDGLYTRLANRPSACLVALYTDRCRYNHYADTILTKDRATTVAHEIGHNWVSGEQWFGEGFNDLQTWYILTATGLRTIDDYVAEINYYIRKLHHSEIRNLPNDQIADNFWKLGDYSWIIYWRGAVYGFRLLGQIEAATGDPHAFKTLMTTLGKERTLGMKKEYFMETVSRFIDRKTLEDEFEKYIIRAETMDLSASPLPSGCRLKFEADGTPQVEITDREAFARHFILE